jgi:hypothetical protein
MLRTHIFTLLGITHAVEEIQNSQRKILELSVFFCTIFAFATSIIEIENNYCSVAQ